MPVRIHPFFWVAALVLGIGFRSGPTPPAYVFSWVLAMLGSILIHELGHAVIQRRFGGHPRIVLHGFGGLAVCGDCDRSPGAQILISLAGPGAGFLFAVLLLVAISLLGHQVGVDLWQRQDYRSLGLVHLSLLGMTFFWAPFQSWHVNLMIFNLLQINVLWGVLNLLPIYPLDGGQVSREICTLRQPRQGIVLSLRISVGAAVAMALVGLIQWESLLMALLFGYLAYSNYQTIQAYESSRW